MKEIASQESVIIMSAQEFHLNPPCNFQHSRNHDWTARVLELCFEMTNSDAQGRADLEYRMGKLPTFSKHKAPLSVY